MLTKITDPVDHPAVESDFFERQSSLLLLDRRDLPFLKLIMKILVTVIPFAVLLFVLPQIKWWIALFYWGCVGYFLGPFILMLHNTSHRILFRRSYSWLNLVIPWVLGPFFGEPPEGYYSHHVGMHHFEANLPGDLSSTMKYQRDSVLDFSRYLGDFLFFGFIRLLVYTVQKRRFKLFRRALLGESSFYIGVAFLALFNLKASLVVFVIPLGIVRFAMMTGNWAQHAFIDENTPENSYRNSITCINSSYNRRCFNDGYHIGHHLKPSLHWTEMPGDFIKNQDRYFQERSLVFSGLDYFGIWCLLMMKDYRRLANRLVQLGDVKVERQEQMLLLQSRTRRIVAQ